MGCLDVRERVVRILGENGVGQAAVVVVREIIGEKGPSLPADEQWEGKVVKGGIIGCKVPQPQLALVHRALP